MSDPQRPSESPGATTGATFDPGLPLGRKNDSRHENALIGLYRTAARATDQIFEKHTRRILAITTLAGAELAGLTIIAAALHSGDTQMAFQVFLILGSYATGALNGYNLARATEQRNGGAQ